MWPRLSVLIACAFLAVSPFILFIFGCIIANLANIQIHAQGFISVDGGAPYESWFGYLPKLALAPLVTIPLFVIIYGLYAGAYLVGTLLEEWEAARERKNE